MNRKKFFLIALPTVLAVITMAIVFGGFLNTKDVPEPYELLTSQTLYRESDLEYYEETSTTEDGIICHISEDYDSSYKLYIEELINNSPYIVEGRIVSIDYEFRNPYSNEKIKGLFLGKEYDDIGKWMIYTVYTVEVENTLRGHTKETIKVTRKGNTGDFQIDKQREASEKSGFTKAFGGILNIKVKYIKVDEGEMCTFLIRERLDDGTYLVSKRSVFPTDSKNGVNVDSLLKAEDQKK